MSPHKALGAACREVIAVARAATATHRHLRDRLTAVLLGSILVDIGCALAAYLLERHAAQTEIHSFGDALFWTSTQLLTVSSLVKNPLTTGGRVLDVAMEAYAITVIATLAGSFGAFFHRRGSERDRSERASAKSLEGQVSG